MCGGKAAAHRHAQQGVDHIPAPEGGGQLLQRYWLPAIQLGQRLLDIGHTGVEIYLRLAFQQGLGLGKVAVIQRGK